MTISPASEGARWRRLKPDELALTASGPREGETNRDGWVTRPAVGRAEAREGLAQLESKHDNVRLYGSHD